MNARLGDAMDEDINSHDNQSIFVALLEIVVTDGENTVKLSMDKHNIAAKRFLDNLQNGKLEMFRQFLKRVMDLLKKKGFVESSDFKEGEENFMEELVETGVVVLKGNKFISALQKN